MRVYAPVVESKMSRFANDLSRMLGVKYSEMMIWVAAQQITHLNRAAERAQSSARIPMNEFGVTTRSAVDPLHPDPSV